jgi:hypothetical protein
VVAQDKGGEIDVAAGPDLIDDLPIDFAEIDFR